MVSQTATDPLFPPISRPASDFGPSPPAGAPAEAWPTAERLHVVAAEPVNHVLEFARLDFEARRYRRRHPGSELCLHLRCDLDDRSAYRSLPFDRVVFSDRGGAPPRPASVCRIEPPSFRVPMFDTADAEARARSFQEALIAESPRWRTAPGAAWPAELPAAPRILIHQARFHVGDVLWLTPLLRSLHCRFPAARVTLVAPPVARRVLAANPHVARVVDFSEDGGNRERRGVLEALDGERFDAALFAFARWPTSTWLAEAAADRGIAVRVNLEYFDSELDPTTIAAWATHEAWCFWSALASPEMLLRALDPFEPRGVSRHLDDRRVEYRGRPEAAVADPPATSPFVVLTPGGQSSERWPAERFVELAGYLVEGLGLDVVIEGSPAEEKLLRGVCARVPKAARGRVRWAADPLDAFAARLARARLLISNDSAPIHFAEAVGTPSLYFAQREKLVHSHPSVDAWALFDPVDNTVARITVDQAAAAARERLGA